MTHIPLVQQMSRYAHKLAPGERHKQCWHGCRGRNRSPARGEAPRAALRSHLYSPSASPASQRPSTDAATNTTPSSNKPPLYSHAAQDGDESSAGDLSQPGHDSHSDDEAAAEDDVTTEHDAAAASGQSSPHTPPHGLQSSPFKRASIQDLASQPQQQPDTGSTDWGDSWTAPAESQEEPRSKSNAGGMWEGEGEGPLGDSGGSNALWQLPPPSPCENDTAPGTENEKAAGSSVGVQHQDEAASTHEDDDSETSAAEGEAVPAQAQYPF